MLRLLAWIKYANERLQFTRGLSAEDEPEARLRNDHLGIDLWIELGLPDERRIKRPVPSPLKWRYSPITSARRRSGGNKTRINVRSIKISPSGIWMMNSWRSSVGLPAGRWPCRQPFRTAPSGSLILRIIWKFI